MNQRMQNPATTRAEVVDQGLRSYMLKIYNFMALALVITGATAWFTASSPDMLAAFYAADGRPTMLGWVVMFAPLAFVLILSFGINRLSYPMAQFLFWTYSAVMGLSLTWIFLAFTGESIVQTFFVTAATFMAMSVYGYTTRRDLSGIGSFLFMGLIGIVIAGLVNIFLQSTMMSFIISAVGVLVFTGLIAYDTQRLKEMYYAGDASDTMGKKALMGALSLYLDFINLFISLLRFMGERR